MLMRTDPFRDLDRLTEAVLGTRARPAVMPMEAYRDDDTFVVHLDLPGVSADSIEATVEQNVLTVRAERKSPASDSAERVVVERPHGVFSRQLFLGENPGRRPAHRGLRRRCPDHQAPHRREAKARRIEVSGAESRKELNA